MTEGSPEGGNKRERLLEWMRDGDPSVVPVMVGPGFYLAASYFGVPLDEVTWESAARAAVETHTENVAFVGMPLPFVAIDFTDKLKIERRHETLSDGTKRRTSVLTTPAGSLREVLDTPPRTGRVRREFFVKGEEDLPVIESFWRIAFDTIFKNPAVRQKVFEDMKARKEAVKGFFPTAIHPFCAAVELMSSFYHDQQAAIFMLHDHRDLMEEIFELHWKMTQIWLELAAKLDVDVYNFAINGLEWLSLDIYERYMIPQAKRIVEFADAHGKLSWIHTCGKKTGLIERDVYKRMGVNVVESLSAPPTGDIEDYAWARGKLGSEVTTRGGVNCELFYAEDLDAIKARGHEVLDGCRGFRHMIGDTNPSVPPYKWETIQALIDVVRERDALFQ